MKLDIPIVLIDESVVDYGFRVLMSGYQGDSFEKNPVLLLQHGRVDQGINGVTSEMVMPLGKWNNVGVQGDKLVGYPEFDDDDPDAVKVGNKVKKGYYNAASVWLEAIDVSDDESLKLPGQYGPTITKWCIREGSIVDIPNCRNAVAIRNNSTGKKIMLNSETTDTSEVLDYLKTFLPKKEIQMDLKLAAVAIGLPETATEQEYNTKLAAIVAENKLAAQYKTDKETAEAKVIKLEKEAGDKKITDLVDGAIRDKKLAAGDREDYIKLATADYATTEKLIGGMKVYTKIEGSVGAESKTEAAVKEVTELMKLSFDELFAQEKLERLKALDIDSFKLKYKEGTGKEYKS